MTVKHISEFEASEVSAGEKTSFQVLISSDQAPHFALRKFSIAPGGSMPRHRNKVEHEQYVLQGKAEVSIGDETHTVKAGDVVFIPAGVPHHYRTLGDESFEFLCAVPNLPDEIEILE